MLFHHWWSILIQKQCNLKARRHPPVSNFHPWQWSSLSESHKNPATPWFDIIYRPDCPTIKPMSRHGHPRFLDKIDNRRVPFLYISTGRQRNNQSFIRAKFHYGNMGNISRFRCNVAKFHFHPPFSLKERWWLRIYIYNRPLEMYSVSICYYLSIYATFARRNFDRSNSSILFWTWKIGRFRICRFV